MRVIRKYANRRLYDTCESRYVTLEDIRQLILNQEEIQVEDSKTGEDITRSVLLQIITEQENQEGNKKEPMFSNKTLQQLIRLYGDSMQNSMGGYLEQSINTFFKQQQLLRQQMQETMLNNSIQTSNNPMQMMRKVAEQNLLLWQKLAKGSFDAEEGEPSTKK